MDVKPVVFIGSSTEALPVAEALQLLLSREAEVALWTQGIFDIGRSYSSALSVQLDKVDFAVLVLTGDDVRDSRGRRSPIPRDNVLLELGLFAGRLGFDRTYFLIEESAPIELPSDLLGIVPATFTRYSSGNLEAALATAAIRMRQQIARIGLRFRISEEALARYKRVELFAKRISGYWWQHITRDDPAALSFVWIGLDEHSNCVRVEGRAYDRDGMFAGHWHTGASYLDEQQRRLYYFWKGLHPVRPSEDFEGFGEISFRETGTGIIRTAEGVYSEINRTNLAQANRRFMQLSRCTEEEADTMQKDQIASLIRKKLQETPFNQTT